MPDCTCPKDGFDIENFVRYDDDGSIVMRCWQCGGEGELNDYESDHLWYGSYDDAWTPCDICDGEGFYKIIKRPPPNEPEEGKENL